MADPAEVPPTLEQELRERAEALGFARTGIARAEPLGVEAERLRAFVEAERHGEMGYMRDTLEVRCDPRHEGMLPGARSVVVLAAPYARAADHARAGGPTPGRVARYARGRDYHNVLGKRARKLAAFLREQGHETRACVDSTPVYERAWAVRAGLGFVGKNCCLIVPGLGSHVLLATLVTTAELQVDAPMRERCGSCTRCLEGCPTQAFVRARELDARRCISYLTIEARGPVPLELREGVGDWLFGCDACQDVCPFNATRPLPDADSAAFARASRWDVPIERLLRMDDAEFRVFAEGSPIKRPGRVGMARNAALVLGNVGKAHHTEALEAAAEHHDDSSVREAAGWALTRLARRAHSSDD